MAKIYPFKRKEKKTNVTIKKATADSWGGEQEAEMENPFLPVNSHTESKKATADSWWQ